MKKVGVLFTILLFSLMLVSAANDTIDEKAYSCLKEQLGDDCGNTNNIEQLSFSLLAMSDNSGIQSDCKSALLDKQKSDNSFGTLKETSLALIALDNIGASTEDEQNYLLSKKKSSELEWYLEIDISGKGKCTLTGGASITINEDKKLSGNTGSCFSLAYSNYWLRIKDSCLDKDLEVSCDKDFISTSIYKRTGSNIWHLSSDIQSASSGSKTTHKITSYCFSTGAGCDYEGSLWAVLALQKTDNEVSAYIPYLSAFAEDNTKFFPDAFLYILTSSNEYLTNIVNLQKTDGFWKININEYYDTALALVSLSGSEPSSAALSWLESKQGQEGCWNNKNIKDTAFIFWAAWPRTPIPGGGGATQDNCEDFDYYCTTQGECDEAKGQSLPNFYCSGLKVCCDTPAVIKTCLQKSGTICSQGYSCSVSVISASDTDNCCTGTCEQEKTECEKKNYVCRSNCLDTEAEESLYACNSGKTCCKEKEAGSLLWLWILIILIILVILGIIFRDRLRVSLFKIKSNFGKSAVTKTRPGFPPAPGLRRMIPQSRMPPRLIRKPASRTDTELEETLKKLREMSK